MIDRLALRRLASAAILGCLLIGAGAPSAAAAGADTPASPSAESIRSTLQQVIADEQIQHDPPHPAETPMVVHRPWNLEWLRYPLWILLGLGVIALLWQAVKTIAQLSRPTGSAPGNVVVEAKVVHQAPSSTPASLPALEEILALARAGAFETALHLLLLRGLDQLGRTTGITPAASLTSREILRRPGLPPAAGGELATLVTAVEVSRFGGRPAGEAIFQACLEAYRRLASALAPAGSARP